MTNLTQGHFHCAECGTLFEADIVDPVDQRCPVCGNPPTGKVLAGASRGGTVATLGALKGDTRSRSGVTQDARDIHQATLETKDKRGRIKRTKRREIRSKKILVLLGVWILLMALTVGLVKYFSPEEEEGEDASVVEARKKWQQEAEQIATNKVIQQAAPLCQTTLINYLNATSAAGKAQFVYQGVKLTTEMNRYYQRNPSFSSVRSQAKVVRAELLKDTQNPTIGAICVNQQKEVFEAVFVRDGEEWKLDWKFLMRYDSRSWSLFPSGNEGDEGEFRLYMRVRDSNKKFDQEEISLVFYKPDLYRVDEFRGIPSPSVRVPVDSDLGRQIIELVGEEDNMEKDIHGFTKSTFDPPGYHRVRVKMKLHKEGLEHSFELVEILADHWYGDGILGSKDTPPAEIEEDAE